MSLKTETFYNEDDFIQQNESLNELTVTITLCEYRNLISEREYNEKEIEELKEENEILRKKVEKLSQLYISKNPEVFEKYIMTIKDCFGNEEIIELTEAMEESESE